MAFIICSVYKIKMAFMIFDRFSRLALGFIRGVILFGANFLSSFPGRALDNQKFCSHLLA